MKSIFQILTIILFFISCKNKSGNQNKPLAFSNKIESIKDSLDFGDFKVYNIYKNQILTYRELKGEKDSIKIASKIVKNLLKPYPAIFKNCFTYSESNFIPWNKAYIENDSLIKERIDIINTINLDSIIKSNYEKVSSFSGHKPTGAWYIYFFQYPEQCNMCGCGLNSMQLNLSYPDFTVDGLNYLLPHELNHNIYDLTNKNDPDKETVLWDVINEGFATYFSKVISKASTTKIFMTYNEKDYEWCLQNEKKIFEKAKPFLFSNNDEDYDELGDSDRNTFMENSPGKLGYFIGYRIVEKFVIENGKDSWKDIYKLPVRELLEKSEYEKYISNLK